MFKRIVVGLIMLALFLVILFAASPLVFDVFILLVIGIAAWEWSALSGVRSVFGRLFYVLLSEVCLIAMMRLAPQFHLLFVLLLLLTIVLWLWCMMAVVTYSHQLTSLGLRFPVVQYLFGLILLVGCGVDMWFLRRQSAVLGPFWVLLPFVIVMMVDTGAYFTGSWFGRHLLAARVSPKKTWEGLWGGLCLAMLAAIVASYCVPLPQLLRYQLWILSLMTAVFSVFGDLLESLLKRQASVKDSGGLIPGHGGSQHS